MFDQRLSDNILTTSIDNRSSAILFFVVADNSTAFPMKVRCILCDTPMTINNGSNGLNTSNLVNHLNEQHFQLHAKMKRRYPSMENLLNGVKFPTIKIERVVPTRQTTLDNTFHVAQVRAIEDGSRKRGGKRREAEEKENEKEKEKEKEEKRREADDIDLSVERTDSNAIERLQLRPPEKRICTSDVNRKIDAYKKVLALVVSGLPLTWDRSRTESEEDEKDEAKAVFEYLLKSFIGTRSLFLHWKDEMIRDVKTVLRNIISRLQSFAICTDAWSAMRPAVHLQVVFLSAFHHNTFFSFLLDSIPIESTEADCIQNATQKVLKEYSINEKVTCTCDGATSNKKAYEGERSECNSHLFDNVLRHFLWSNKSTAKFKGTKNG